MTLDRLDIEVQINGAEELLRVARDAPCNRLVQDLAQMLESVVDTLAEVATQVPVKPEDVDEPDVFEVQSWLHGWKIGLQHAQCRLTEVMRKRPLKGSGAKAEQGLRSLADDLAEAALGDPEDYGFDPPVVPPTPGQLPTTRRADAPRQEDGAVERAIGWLRDLMRTAGPLLRPEIRRRAAAAGLGWRTVERARERAGVDSRRTGARKPTVWFLKDVDGKRPANPS
ncbi:MAG: hypothetical protein KIT17_00660 [Rubrivivax sp.]|nr:hypothetical protein [Rubrivivax sp.]